MDDSHIFEIINPATPEDIAAFVSQPEWVRCELPPNNAVTSYIAMANNPPIETTTEGL